MKEILSYNFNDKINLNTNWDNFFSYNRRDANFAAVFEVAPNEYIAIRDHLGTIPLYYRIKKGHIIWSMTYDALSPQKNNLTKESIKQYLGFPSSKIVNLDSEIKIVPPGSVVKVRLDSVKTIFNYKMNIVSISLSRDEIKNHLNHLLDQAVERTIRESSVGLYLSGGMDSGLLGSILNKKGIGIRAYTALPWGKDGTEYAFSKINSEIIGVLNHTFSIVETRKYNDYLSGLKKLYQTPNGSVAAINIASLWQETNIANEKQLFFAQNTDTLTSSVPAQSHAIITGVLPKIVRRLFVDMPLKGTLENYLYFCNHGNIFNHPYEEYIDKKLPTDVQIAQAGMYIAHTPTDCESINAPSVATKQLSSNPYYDMDLIEFYLGINIKHKLGFSMNSKTKVYFEKNLFREIALNFLPKELVYRKKGFTLPQYRDDETAKFYNSLPSELSGVTARNNFEKLSLKILTEHLE